MVEHQQFKQYYHYRNCARVRCRPGNGTLRNNTVNSHWAFGCATASFISAVVYHGYCRRNARGSVWISPNGLFIHQRWREQLQSRMRVVRHDCTRIAKRVLYLFFIIFIIFKCKEISSQSRNSSANVNKMFTGIYVYLWEGLFDYNMRNSLSQRHELVQTNTFTNKWKDNIQVTKMTVLHQNITILVSLIKSFSAKLWWSIQWQKHPYKFEGFHATWKHSGIMWKIAYAYLYEPRSKKFTSNDFLLLSNDKEVSLSTKHLHL